MGRFIHIQAAVIIVLLFCPAPSPAAEIESRYAVIRFAGPEDLRTFNEKLYMGRLQPQMRQDMGGTVEKEVAAKIDFIVEKVMTVLDMYPRGLRLSIVIRPDTASVQQDFMRLYKSEVDYIAFYSPSTETVFFSAGNATLSVVAHEIGHVVAENYFTISPPAKIHEVMAQYAEQHITD